MEEKRGLQENIPQHDVQDFQDFKAVKPDPVSLEMISDVSLLCVLAQKIRELIPAGDISEVMKEVEKLLDDSDGLHGAISEYDRCLQK